MKVVIILLLLSSNAFGDVFKSKEYYSQMIGTQIQARLHGLNTDTKEVFESEIKNHIFNFIRFQLDKQEKRTYIK